MVNTNNNLYTTTRVLSNLFQFFLYASLIKFKTFLWFDGWQMLFLGLDCRMGLGKMGLFENWKSIFLLVGEEESFAAPKSPPWWKIIVQRVCNWRPALYFKSGNYTIRETQSPEICQVRNHATKNNPTFLFPKIAATQAWERHFWPVSYKDKKMIWIPTIFLNICPSFFN